MANATDYLEQKVGDHVLGIATFTKPTSVYLACHLSTISDTGLHTNEVASGVGYSRASITSVMNPTSSPSGAANNASIITIGPATADWGTVTYVSIEDGSTIGGANMLVWILGSVAKLIQTGDSFQITANQLSLVVG